MPSCPKSPFAHLCRGATPERDQVWPDPGCDEGWVGRRGQDYDGGLVGGGVKARAGRPTSATQSSSGLVLYTGASSRAL